MNLIKQIKMFRKLQKLNLTSKDEKKKNDKHQSKYDKQKPLIKVIHDTVTKNNIKLIVNNDKGNEINKFNKLSINNENLSNSNNLINNNLENDQLMNRKIEDVRSRSECKLTNCQRKSTKIKSESFYFIETKQDHLDNHLNKELNKIKLKNHKEKEEFLNKKLIAESLVKSNRTNEMNNLFNQSINSTTSITNKSSSNQTTNHLNESTNSSLRIPSYIGISCAISGYSTYNNKYNGNLSERNSPSNIIRRLNDPINNNLLDNKLNGDGKFLDINRKIESYNSFKNNLNYSNRFNQLNNSNHLTNLNQYDSFDNSLLNKDLITSNQLNKDSNDKSLVQKRIESLYGERFASNWKENRIKLRIEKTNNDSTFRSPSCPPEFITNGFSTSNKKNLPVFKYIKNSIFNNNEKDLNKSDNQAKSDETINDNSINKNDNKLNHEFNSLNIINIDNNLIDNEPNNELNNLESIKEDILNDNLIDKQSIDELDNIRYNNDLINLNNNIKNEDESYDGKWYLNKLDNEIEKINLKIKEVESINLDHDLNNREEIDGKIRSSIGKANLLINQKLLQFKELCNKNINQTPDEKYKTLNQDLDGFYEMVSYQIDDIHKTFDEILFLKNNNWILSNLHNDLLNPSPRKTNSRNSSRTNSNANSRCNSKPNSKSSSRNTSKEDLRRLKLREIKRKQQQNNQQQNDDDNIVIFLPTNKSETKIDDL